VAIDPEYKNKSTRQFVSGGMAEQLIMNEKGWLGHKDIVLHANEGPIYSIKWRGNFIAWANDTGVKMYDTTSNLRITYIDRPAGSPRGDLYRCRMCWKDDSTLLIGWADMVKIAKVRVCIVYKVCYWKAIILNLSRFVSFRLGKGQAGSRSRTA
jgi:hypothetical protein